MAGRFNVSPGDKLQVKVDDKTGWVDGVVDYADSKGVSFIVATEKNGRYSFADSSHVDLRKPVK